MAEIKMPVFKSDAIFKGNVEVKEIIIASQIQDNSAGVPLTKAEEIWLREGEVIGGDQERTSWKVSFSTFVPPVFPLTEENILKIAVCNASHEEWAGTYTQIKQTNTRNFILEFETSADAPEMPGTYDIVIQCKYINEIQRSYNKKPFLYGPEGSLYIIQKNLENLTKNFEQLQYSSAQQNITKNNLILDLSADLVLEKSATNVNEILSDINLRLKGVGV